MNTVKSFALTLGVLALSACGGDSGSGNESGVQINIDESPISEEKAEDLVRGITDAFNQLNEDIEVVAARDLKALMPESISGMTRTAYSASKNGIEGFSISTSSATFEEDDGPGVLDLSVTDIGKVRGFAQFGLENIDLEIDEENQDGFKRTGDYKGHKSFQSWSKTRFGSEADVTVFIGDRLVLRAEGQNIEWETVEDVVDAVQIKEMEALIK